MGVGAGMKPWVRVAAQGNGLEKEAAPHPSPGAAAVSHQASGGSPQRQAGQDPVASRRGGHLPKGRGPCRGQAGTCAPGPLAISGHQPKTRGPAGMCLQRGVAPFPRTGGRGLCDPGSKEGLPGARAGGGKQGRLPLGGLVLAGLFPNLKGGEPPNLSARAASRKVALNRLSWKQRGRGQQSPGGGQGALWTPRRQQFRGAFRGLRGPPAQPF